MGKAPEPMHIYPLGQVHLMGPACWCCPCLLMEDDKYVWMHRFMRVQEDHGEEDLGVTCQYVINHSETVH